MDAGAGKESAFLPGLARLGYTDLTGINLIFPSWEDVGTIHYRQMDITNTVYHEGEWDFIACLSVLEHGVDIPAFFKESARILKPGGHLFVSVDYWPDNVSVGDRHVFDQDEMYRMIGTATVNDFVIAGPPPDFHAETKVISWYGMDYTFMNLLFRRVADGG